MEHKQFCVFGVEELIFGIDVSEVEEVNRRYKMTRVPLAPSSVAGLINLRGRIVTAIDMRERLHLPPLVDTEAFHIVATSRDLSISLLVDYIGDVVTVSEADFEEAPETMQKTTRELVKGLYKLDRTLLLVLDLSKTVAFVHR